MPRYYGHHLLPEKKDMGDEIRYVMYKAGGGGGIMILSSMSLMRETFRLFLISLTLMPAV